MPTARLNLNQNDLNSPASNEALSEAASILRRGGTVAFPTETVYGLGANALDPEAVAKIFTAKQRPSWDPLIVHIADEAMLRLVASEIPMPAQKLIKFFWPGALTLLLPRASSIPDAVTAGRPLVGVRMPAHPVARDLIRIAALPIAAPSANYFGHTSPTTAQHVLDDLDGRIDAVLDAGPTPYGLESTVLDPNLSPMIIYRPGAVTLQQIESVAGPVRYFTEDAEFATQQRTALPSPGVGLRHYAPRARLVLFDPSSSTNEKEASWLQSAVSGVEAHLGLMYAEGMPTSMPWLADPRENGFAAIFAWGRWSYPEELAHRLFAGLRYLDSAGCTVILCPVPPEDGIGQAIRDRLRKAAWVESPESSNP